MKNIILLAGVIAMLFSCKQQNSSYKSEETGGTGVSNIELMDVQQPTEKQKATTTDSAGTTQGDILQQSDKVEPPKAGRHIIKTAHIEVECNEFKKYTQALQATLKSHNGWIESEEESTSDYRHQNQLKIKVPVEKFEPFLASLGSLNGNMLQKKIEATDVTRDVIDTRGRLEAKKQIRERYMALLGQAKSMEDILKVQTEIDRITEEMESAAYNLKNMQSEAAFSTVNLTYFQAVDYEGISKPSYLQQLWSAVKDGGSGIASVALLVVTLWPLWLVAIALYLFWKRRKAAQKPKF